MIKKKKRKSMFEQVFKNNDGDLCGPAPVPPPACGSGETLRIFASAVALVATTLRGETQ
jgi:hypothetical protein